MILKNTKLTKVIMLVSFLAVTNITVFAQESAGINEVEPVNSAVYIAHDDIVSSAMSTAHALVVITHQTAHATWLAALSTLGNKNPLVIA